MSEIFVFWSRKRETFFMTNNYGYTGTLIKIPGLRKQPSQGFIQENYGKILMNLDNFDLGKWKPALFLREERDEAVSSILELMTGEKNLRWWRFKI